MNDNWEKMMAELHYLPAELKHSLENSCKLVIVTRRIKYLLNEFIYLLWTVV